ncbi:calcium/sodium antiporter [Nitrincola tapanii]|uniref:Calcium/sodium antiporter n=1 Tax=Nitrincola tapanii TaxID=1708751 RepID=A0A5A9W0R7_9GAMM|nr:calcium/sodium antiporter [Nitrincola tapanii]KAA0874143.1 calcium/sodium antiporter [Nitrincola tapanii]
MLLSVIAIVVGLAVLVWSADRFVDGAAATARYAGMPPLLIGMVIIGFGTSAPELFISAISALEGNPGLALGNGYGSNIANIGLILGLTALISPIAVKSDVLRREIPLLALVTLISGALLLNGKISRLDATLMLLAFALVMGWSVYQGMKEHKDTLGQDMQEALESETPLSRGMALFWLLLGLVLLIISSRALVWGAINIASTLGVSDLVIGLTVVAVGTSLPELAAALAAIRKGENDLALGNVIGSNLFNTLAVVGLAGLITPLSVPSEVIWRDWPIMAALTFSLFIMGYGFRGPGTGRINRFEGGALFLTFVAYTCYLVLSIVN